MADTEKITGRILQQAQAQAQEILDTAKMRADEAIREALKEADAKAEQIVQQAQQEAQASALRAISVADLTLRKQLLAQKHAVVNEAFDKAFRAFSAMPDERFISIYKKLVLDAVQKGDECVVPAKADESRLGESFVALVNRELEQKGIKANIKLLPSRDSIEGGLILTSGEMEIDLSVKSVLQGVKDRYEGEVAAMLFAFLEG